MKKPFRSLDCSSCPTIVEQFNTPHHLRVRLKKETSRPSVRCRRCVTCFFYLRRPAAAKVGCVLSGLHPFITGHKLLKDEHYHAQLLFYPIKLLIFSCLKHWTKPSECTKLVVCIKMEGYVTLCYEGMHFTHTCKPTV